MHHFQRVPLWDVEATVTADHQGRVGARALPGDLDDTGSPQWSTELAGARLPWLHDHVVAGAVLLPGAAYLDAGLAAATELFDRPVAALDDVRFVAPLVIDRDDAPSLRLSAEAASGRFEVCSRSADSLYERLAARGLEYGPNFRRIISARLGEGQQGLGAVWAQVNATPSPADGDHQAHPAVLDAALQCVALLVGRDDSTETMVPAAVRHVRQFGPLTGTVQIGVTRLAPIAGETSLVADVVICDEAGAALLELHRAQFASLTPATRNCLPSNYLRSWRAGRPAPPRPPRGSTPPRGRPRA